MATSDVDEKAGLRPRGQRDHDSMNVNKDLRILSLLQIFQDASLTNKNTVVLEVFM